MSDSPKTPTPAAPVGKPLDWPQDKAWPPRGGHPSVPLEKVELPEKAK